MSQNAFRSKLPFVGLLSLCCLPVHAQISSCGVAVFAGQDQYYCQAGQVINLNGQISGDYLAAYWSPANGLSNPNALQTSLQTVGPAEYRLVVQNLTGPELVINGDFSQGNTGFTSSYAPGTSGQYGPVTNPGTFGISTTANLVHSQFAPCTDHSGGNRMMIVNGATSVSNIWCQTISVSPQTEYAFSAWFAVVATQNPSVIRFSFNGQPVGSNFTLPNATCNWTRFFRVWDSGNATSVQICIQNMSTSAAGNDFCLDDISLRQFCESADTIVIRPASLNPSFQMPPVLCENQAPLHLNSLLNSTSTPGGQWRVNGMVATQLDPAVVGPGIHDISYKVIVGDCEEESIRPLQVVAIPNAGMQGQALEVCAGERRQIELLTLLSDADAGGTWSDISFVPCPAGAFTPSNGMLFTENLVPATYRFQYKTEAFLPCPGDSSVVEVIVRPRPVADAGADQILDCRMRQVSIGGPQTSSGLGFLLQWTSADGGWVFQQGIPFTETDRPGTYVLSVRQEANGCEARDTVVVTSVITEPSFSWITDPVTCSGDSDGSITVTNIQEAASPWMLNINNGPSQDHLQFSGLRSGTYTLRLEDANGCTATREIHLQEPPPITVELITALQGQYPWLHLGDSTWLELVHNLPEDAIQSVVWSPALPDCENCTRISISPHETTFYEAILTDTNGCLASASLTIRVNKTLRLFVPDAFSPNGDGINDVLMPFGGAEVIEIRQFTVADRWGNLVFHQENFPSSDPNWGWDGKQKGQAVATGIYVYFLDALLVDGRTVTVSGDITLLR